MFNEFASGHDLVFGSNATSGWQLEQSLFAPGPQGQDEQVFITHLINDLTAKRFGANFTVTFCDLWGRAVSLLTKFTAVLPRRFFYLLLTQCAAGVSLSTWHVAGFVRVEHYCWRPRGFIDIFVGNQLVSA